MSYWCYINGTVVVRPMGRTQAEKRYILDTVLNHLPRVTGSEGDMNIYVIKKNGFNYSSSSDEFGEITNNLIDHYGDKSRNGWLQIQDEYILVVNAALRDREFKQTFYEFMKWICRLGKRISIEDILIEIKGYNKSTVIQDRNIQRKKHSYKNVFGELFEEPSWYKGKEKYKEPNWCEYLMWDRAKNSSYPMTLAYKYFNDEENDKEVERRLDYYNK